MLVLSTSIDVNTAQSSLAQGVLGQHALDSHAHSQSGVLLHQDAVGGLLQAAGPTGVVAIELLSALVAGQDSLASVDDDDVVAAVGVGV